MDTETVRENLSNVSLENLRVLYEEFIGQSAEGLDKAQIIKFLTPVMVEMPVEKETIPWESKEKLPDFVLLEILEKMTIFDIISLSKTSKTFRSRVKDDIKIKKLIRDKYDQALNKLLEWFHQHTSYKGLTMNKMKKLRSLQLDNDKLTEIPKPFGISLIRRIARRNWFVKKSSTFIVD